MPTDAPDYSDYGDSLFGGNYDIDNYLYQDPLTLEEEDLYEDIYGDIYGDTNYGGGGDNAGNDYGIQQQLDLDGPAGGGLEDPAMYFDEITTTTVPPDMYDYLFSHSRLPDRNRIKTPARKKFDAQALKAAYAEILKKAKDQDTASRVTRSVLTDVEYIARQFLQRITGPEPKVFGLLDRRAPLLFRQNAFVKISLSQFAIVSTGTTGKFFVLLFIFSLKSTLMVCYLLVTIWVIAETWVLEVKSRNGDEKGAFHLFLWSTFGELLKKDFV